MDDGTATGSFGMQQWWQHPPTYRMQQLHTPIEYDTHGADPTVALTPVFLYC
jgi:hypothetical protein